MPLRATPAAHVRRLFDHCETWQELVCLSTLAYVGARRGAVSRLRWRDVDTEQGVVTFSEKGGKVITQPMPGAYLAILRAAVAQGGIEPLPSAHVIPMQRPQRRIGERDDRIIWRIVKGIGKRAGIDVFPHALRHAFSVRFLEQHPGEIEALQRLLGHLGVATTQRYVRAMEQRRLMERSRDLSWISPFEAITAKRRRADSNRRTRLCRPLPNHSAKAPAAGMVSASSGNSPSTWAPSRSLPRRRRSPRCARPSRRCRGCDLYRKTATQAVFGEGSRGRGGDVRRRAARRPGGPRGQAVRRPGRPAARPRARGGRASTASQAYVTNVVKHFKWQRARQAADPPEAELVGDRRPAGRGSTPSSRSSSRACSSASARPRRRRCSAATSASRSSAASRSSPTSPST